MPLTNKGTLSQCIIKTNCVLTEWELEDVNVKYKHLIGLASSLPRTTIVKQEKNYWHGICRSLIFRFPDDLEILNLGTKMSTIQKKGIIQIRSASRYGASDLGVNKNRINNLYKKLMELS